MIEFYIAGTPVGKERPRLSKYGIYTPAKTQQYEKYVGELALVARNNVKIFSPLDCFVFVTLDIYCKSKRSADIDNIIKSVLDGMNKIIYDDDSQVVALDCSKEINSEKQEGVNVIVSLLNPDRSRGARKIICPRCNSSKVVKNGFDRKTHQLYVCGSCNKYF